MKKIAFIFMIFIVVGIAFLSGCSDQQPQTVENKNPTISILANITKGTAPLTVSFMASGNDSDGVITSYNWSFGDRSTSHEQNPTHTYTSKGKFLVKLTVTDDDGGSDIDNIAIIVTQP
jgi:PKD repeat protein